MWFDLDSTQSIASSPCGRVGSTLQGRCCWPSALRGIYWWTFSWSAECCLTEGRPSSEASGDLHHAAVCCPRSRGMHAGQYSFSTPAEPKLSQINTLIEPTMSQTNTLVEPKLSQTNTQAAMSDNKKCYHNSVQLSYYFTVKIICVNNTSASLGLYHSDPSHSLAPEPTGEFHPPDPI